MNAYEAFIINRYRQLIIGLLGGTEATIQVLSEKDPKYGKPKGCFKCCCKEWEMGLPFLEQVKFGTHQLIVVKCINAICICIFAPLEKYGNMKFSSNVYTIMSIIVIFSTIKGMYAIYMFSNATKEYLRSPKKWKPTGKLVSIKCVIGLTHLIGLIIAILVNTGAIKNTRGWDEDRLAASLQNYIYCILMVFISILNSFVYSYLDFRDTEQDNADDERNAIIQQGTID